jgi:hypothetical protein
MQDLPDPGWRSGRAGRRNRFKGKRNVSTFAEMLLKRLEIRGRHLFEVERTRIDSVSGAAARCHTGLGGGVERRKTSGRPWRAGRGNATRMSRSPTACATISAAGPAGSSGCAPARLWHAGCLGSFEWIGNVVCWRSVWPADWHQARSPVASSPASTVPPVNPGP